jgi:TetR/AcrR family transcriptional regulator
MNASEPELHSSQARLLDAAEAIMRESGYAAVTSRQVAARAGLKPQLVHYHFRNMDELFLALFQRIATELIRRQEEAARSDNPLREMWNNLTDNWARALLHEFVALGNHRKIVRTLIGDFGNQFRQKQTELMADILRKVKPDDLLWTPAFASLLLNSLARGMALENELGMHGGHLEAMKVIDHYLDKYDNLAASLDSKIRTLELENFRLRKQLEKDG